MSKAKSAKGKAQVEAKAEDVLINPENIFGIIPAEHTSVALDWDESPSAALVEQTEEGKSEAPKPKVAWPKIKPIVDKTGRGPAEVYVISPEVQLEYGTTWDEHFKPDGDYWEKQGITRLARKVMSAGTLPTPPTVRFTIDWLFELCRDYSARNNFTTGYIVAVMNYRRTVMAINLAGQTALECQATCNLMSVVLEKMLPNCGPIIATILQPNDLMHQGHPYSPTTDAPEPEKKKIKSTELEFGFRRVKRWGKEPLV